MEDYRTDIKQNLYSEAELPELRSAEVQEILGMIPHWIIRWGITVMLFIIMGGLFLSWLIQYPDIIPARITLTTSPPPVRIYTKSGGKISHLFIENHAQVSAGTYLAAIENAAKIESVLDLEKRLKAVSLNTIAQQEWPDLTNLGELQASYSVFVKALENEKFHNESGSYHQGQKATFYRQASELIALNKNLEEQLEILKRDVEISRDRFNINQSLFADSVISKTDLEQSETIFLQKELSIKQLRARIFQNNIQIEDYRKNVKDLDQVNSQTGFAYNLGIKDAFQQLISKLEIWKQQYIIIAPDSGEVAFLDVWTPYQYVSPGTEILSILPATTKVIGKATVSSIGAGKLKVGQKVNIKLDNYDFSQYGMLVGNGRSNIQSNQRRAISSRC